MRSRLPLRWGITLGLLLSGCHTIKPEAPVEGVPEACCTQADPQLKEFKGCRIPQRSCRSRKGEKWWIRGNVWCDPVDEAACDGGRCCHYEPMYDPNVGKPIENWAPPGHDAPTNNITDPDAPPQPEPSETTDAPAETEGALALTITADGSLTLDGRAVDQAELKSSLCASVMADPATALSIDADPGIEQDVAIAVVEAAKECGVTKVSLSSPDAEAAG